MTSVEPPNDHGSDRRRDALQLRRDAERRVVQQIADTGRAEGAEVHRLLHELGVHQAELEIQNEELRRVQELLEESRSRYFDLFDQAPVGYLTLNERDTIHDINRCGAQMLGIQRRPMVNRRLHHFVWIGHQEALAQRRAELFETGKPQELEVQLRGANNRWFWCRLQMNLVEHSGSAERWARVALLDISDSRRIQESMAQLAAIVTSSSDAIISTDSDGQITSWNEGAEVLYGYAMNDVLSASIDVIRSPDAPAPSRHVGTHGVSGEETEHRRRDGSVVSVSMAASPIIAAGGRRLGTAFICRDISQQRADQERMSEMLAEIQQQAGKLREADVRKDEFLAMLAHELRNPLAPIRNAVSVMRLSELDDPRLTWCRDVIERQVSQMSALLEDLMDVSRFTRGRITLHLSRVRLMTALQRAIETVQPALAANQHALDSEVDDDSLEMDGDLSRLVQVFGNILSNAAKYTGRGGHIRVSLRRLDGWARVLISDSGIGIATHDLVRVFDTFSQVETSLDRAQGGLGIGLSLVRALVELHGGVVMVASEGRGKGSTFAVYLPLAPAESPANDDSNGLDRIEEVQPRRILVVDDNRDAADSLAVSLRLLGHTVSIARDGQSALALATSIKPEVVLLDLGLPDMDGTDVALRLRENFFTRSVLIIACTGRAEEDVTRTLPPGTIQFHAMKPYNIDRLHQLIRDHVVVEERAE